MFNTVAPKKNRREFTLTIARPKIRLHRIIGGGVHTNRTSKVNDRVSFRKALSE